MEAQGSAVLPTFLGSTLRGTFGHAFKAAACVLEPANCRQGCGSELCAYGYGFETAIPAHRSATGSHEDLPVPFVLIPPPLDSPVERRYTRGDQLEFTLRWFGRGTKLSEFVKGAVNDLGRYGLGAQRTPFTVTDMEESQVKTLADMVAERLPALSRPETIRLRFL
ncbi:MAG TPA: hypothetical protein PLL06_11915, partial [Acidobacteriota bacterium]|nr:hypothetical protein [Acidobacteriota bacterium]